MLDSTFCHMPGIGRSKEAQVWEAGYTCWEDLLSENHTLAESLFRRAKAGSLESISRLNEMDHIYFRDLLPRGMEWRAYNQFKDDAAFLDIETTGLSSHYNDVTTVCVHSKKSTKIYINGQNLMDLKKDMRSFKYLVTFNGARFDLPFLAARLHMTFPQIHLDLLYPLRALGYSGGLKRVEEQLGLSRETAGVTGKDAVRLWKSYKRKTPLSILGKTVSGTSALKVLTDYNRDDTVNLEELADLAYKKLLVHDGLPKAD